MIEQKLVFRVTERQETLRTDAANPRQCKLTFRADCPDKSVLPDDAELTLTFGTAGSATRDLSQLKPGDRIAVLLKDTGPTTTW